MSIIAPEATGLTEKEQALLNKLLSNPLLFPVVYKTWLVNFLGTELTVTASQVVSAETGVFSGAGAPEGSTAANVGSIYLRTDGGTGTSVYFKESGTGTTGWQARDIFTNGLTISDGKDVSIGSGTGTKIGAAGAKIAFRGKTPADAQDYTMSNVTTDRVLDADSTTLAEVADVLGTLVGDLIDQGILK